MALHPPCDERPAVMLQGGSGQKRLFKIKLLWKINDYLQQTQWLVNHSWVGNGNGTDEAGNLFTKTKCYATRGWRGHRFPPNHKQHVYLHAVCRGLGWIHVCDQHWRNQALRAEFSMFCVQITGKTNRITSTKQSRTAKIVSVSPVGWIKKKGTSTSWVEFDCVPLMCAINANCHSSRCRFVSATLQINRSLRTLFRGRIRLFGWRSLRFQSRMSHNFN